MELQIWSLQDQFPFTFEYEVSSTNPLWLCLSWTISQTNVLSSLEDLNTSSHQQGAMRSTKLIQMELYKPKRGETLGMIFFPLFGFWSCSGLSLLKACWNMLESPIGCGCKVSDTQNEGFMVSPFLVLVFSQRHEHCNYHLQLLWTCLITTFLPYHLLPLRKMCVFLHKDHCNAFCRVADEVCCPPGLRPWTIWTPEL